MTHVIFFNMQDAGHVQRSKLQTAEMCAFLCRCIVLCSREMQMCFSAIGWPISLYEKLTACIFFERIYMQYIKAYIWA